MKKKTNMARADLERGCDLYDEGKFEEALSAFVTAAKLGDPYAQVNLANMYDAGQGVPRSPKTAAYWYKRAVKMGMAEAAYNLAVLYRQQKQPRWASFWLTRAANMGDEDAKEEIINRSET